VRDFDEVYSKVRNKVGSGKFRGQQSPANLRTIFDLYSYIPRKNPRIVELGTNSGTSALMMALSWADLNPIINAIDINITSQVQQGIKELGVDCINLIKGNSHEVEWKAPIEVLHIDADHSYEAVKEDLERWSPLVVKDGLIFLHDYGNKGFPGVRKAVDEWLKYWDCKMIETLCTYKAFTKGYYVK